MAGLLSGFPLYHRQESADNADSVKQQGFLRDHLVQASHRRSHLAALDLRVRVAWRVRM
jgi:hypothetical protein